MNNYEATFIFKPDLSKDNLEKVLGQVRDVIAKHDGSQSDIKDWGKQRLAYPIKKYKEGFYYIMNFNIPSEIIAEIKKAFGLNESILRVMIIKQGGK